MARSNHYVMAALNLCTAATPETAASLWQLQEDVLRARIDTKEWLGGLWYRCESNRRDEKAGDVVYEEIGEFDLGPSMAAAVGGAIGVGERPHKGKRRWRVCVCVLLSCFYMVERGGGVGLRSSGGQDGTIGFNESTSTFDPGLRNESMRNISLENHPDSGYMFFYFF